MGEPINYDPKAHTCLLTAYYISAQPGERVLVQTTTLALPLVEELHRLLLERGATPLIRLEYPTQLEDFQRLVVGSLLDATEPLLLAKVESLAASIRTLTPSAPAQGL